MGSGFRGFWCLGFWDSNYLQFLWVLPTNYGSRAANL